MMKKQISKYGLVLLLILLGGVGEAVAQRVAVKTNLLLDAAMAPNLGVEFVCGERSTIDLSVFGAEKVYGNRAKILGTMPEYRYWFNGRPMTREFFGVALLAASYDINWKGHLYDGDAYGAGLTLGYIWTLSRRLNIEFCAGFGALYFRQKQYVESDNYQDFHTSPAAHVNATGYKLVPMKLGINFSYILW